MGMAHEGGACVWRGLVCVPYRCGSECLSDTPPGDKKITNSQKKMRGVGEKGKNGRERERERERESLKMYECNRKRKSLNVKYTQQSALAQLGLQFFPNGEARNSESWLVLTLDWMMMAASQKMLLSMGRAHSGDAGQCAC